VKRAILLGITTVMWVAASQVISGATAPPRVVDLTANDLDAERNLETPLQNLNADGIGVMIEGALYDSFEAFLNRVGRSPASTFSVEEIPLQTAPATTSAATTTTTGPTATNPSTTVTARPVATTAPPATTSAPATTAPPTTAPPPITTAPPATTIPAGNFDGGAEADFLGRINGLRGSVGVGALTSNAELNNYARWWAKEMADSDNFAHSNIGSLLNPWTIVGENIAYGASVSAMFTGLTNSSGHYNNMIESRYTSVGVGVYVDSSGRLWTCHVFAG